MERRAVAVQPYFVEPYWLRKFVRWPYTFSISDNDNGRNVFVLGASRREWSGS